VISQQMILSALRVLFRECELIACILKADRMHTTWAEAELPIHFPSDHSVPLCIWNACSAPKILLRICKDDTIIGLEQQSREYMERIFPRQIESLEKIFEFIREFIEQHHLRHSVAYTVNLAVEEIFTNLVKYDPRGSTGISINLAKNRDDLTIRLIDSDSNRFDITKWRGEDIAQTLRKKKVGGLGLHLVRNMVDDVYYDYENRTSTITMVKHLEHDDVGH